MENSNNLSAQYLQLVLSANVNPIAQIHTSWLTHLPHGELCLKLLSSPESSLKLQEYLQYYYSWINKYEFEADKWPGQLAILSADNLRRFLLYLGAWYFSPQIKLLIKADSVAKIKSALGEDGYFFAIKQAPFLWNKGYRAVQDKPSVTHSSLGMSSGISSEKDAGVGAGTSAEISTKPNDVKNNAQNTSSNTGQNKAQNTEKNTTRHNKNKVCLNQLIDKSTGSIEENICRVGLVLISEELKSLAEPLKMRLFSKLPYCWYLQRQQLQSDPLMALDDYADAILIKRILVECLPQCSTLLQSNKRH